MNAKDIVNKLKDVLLSSSVTEEIVEQSIESNKVEEKAIQENLESEVIKDDEISNNDPNDLEVELEEVSDEMKHTPDHKEYEEKPKAMNYATKEEVAEIRAMVESLKGKMDAKEEAKQEVPQELSSDEPADAIQHSPENEVNTSVKNVFGNNTRNTTYARVLQRIAK